MFRIVQMSSASEWYYLSIVNYYLRRKSRWKRRRARGSEDEDDDSPDDDSDPDDGGMLGDDASPYTVETLGEPPGIWGGSGAPMLGLLGIVHEDDYHQAFCGFHPRTGKPLVQNAGKPNRRAGWEGCVTPPKCVSILFSQMSPEDRLLLQKVHWQAAEATIRFIEKHYAFSRVGSAKEGCRYVPVKLVVPMFEHASARPTPNHLPDPNLHIHLQILNIGIDESGSPHAIDSAPIFANQQVITTFYRAKLAAGLRKEFGLVVEVTENGFRIPGIPQELIKIYSKRRQQILDYIAEHKPTGPNATSLAALETRLRKEPLISRKELFDHWQETNRAAGFDDKSVARLLRNRPRKPRQMAAPETSPPVASGGPNVVSTPTPDDLSTTSSSPIPVSGALQPVAVADTNVTQEPTSSDASAAAISGTAVADSPQRPIVTDTVTTHGPTPSAADTTDPLATVLSEASLPALAAASIAHEPTPNSAETTTPATTPGSDALQPPAAANENATQEPIPAGTSSSEPPPAESYYIPRRSHCGPPAEDLDTEDTPRRKKASPRAIKKIIREAVRGLTYLRNHFSHNDLVFAVYRILPKYGYEPEWVWDEVTAYLKQAPDLVPLNGQRYSTKRTLKDEQRMLAALERMAQRPGLKVSDAVLGRQLKKHATLSEDQVDFVRHLAQHNQAIRLGIGLAGGGKSFVTKVLVAAWKRAGYRVLAVAPTGQAAEVLARETGIPCETATKFLGDYRLPLLVVLAFHLRQYWRVIRGRRPWRIHKPKPAKITRKTIVLVDESGMLGTPHMRMLLELVQRGGGTVCLVGDPRQLPSVASTPPLNAIVRKYGAAHLTKNRRQRKEWAREVAEAFAEGYVGHGLAILVEKHRVNVRDTLDEAIKAACLDWTAEGLLTPQRAVIIANRNKYVHKANLQCQEHRLRAGVLGYGASIRIIDEQDDNVYESRAYVGDRVLCTRNSMGHKGYGVVNGSTGTVKAISPYTSEIAVMLDNGRYVTINVAKYRNIRLGYAGTTWKLQGATVPKTYVIVGGIGQNLPVSYTQVTRAVEETQFYTTKNLLAPDFYNVRGSKLAWQMAKKPDLSLASEYLPGAPLDLRPQPLHLLKTPHQPPTEKSMTDTTKARRQRPKTSDRRKTETQGIEDQARPNSDTPPETSTLDQEPLDTPPVAASPAPESRPPQPSSRTWDEPLRNARQAALRRLAEARLANQPEDHTRQSHLAGTVPVAKTVPSREELQQVLPSSGTPTSADRLRQVQAQQQAWHALDPQTRAELVQRDRSAADVQQRALSERLEEFRRRKSEFDLLQVQPVPDSHDSFQAAAAQGSGSILQSATDQPSESNPQAAIPQPPEESLRHQPGIALQRLVEARLARQEQEQSRSSNQPTTYDPSETPPTADIPLQPQTSVDIPPSAGPLFHGPASTPIAPISASCGVSQDMPATSSTPAPASTPLHSGQFIQPLGTSPGVFPLPAAATLQPFADASHGYQRMRLPAGAWTVTNTLVLAASCVDGGMNEFRHRPPAPVNQTMTFSTPSIQVLRIVPVPSALMTLEQATRAGMFWLAGTGCQDALKVRCAPGEVWQVRVTNPLALISSQNDVAAAEQHYNRPAILTELTRLDQLGQQLIAFSARRCFLTAFFTCTRREIAWQLPTASDPARLTTTLLDRMCRMLFEDPQAHHLLESYTQHLRPAEELALAKAFQDSASRLSHPPSPEAAFALGLAIAKGQPEREHLLACVKSVGDQLLSATPGEINQASDALGDVIADTKIYFQKRYPTPQQVQAILDTLYAAANRAVPQHIQVPSILTHPEGFDNDFLQEFPFAKIVWTYATAYVRGNTDDTQNLYRLFSSSSLPRRYT